MFAIFSGSRLSLEDCALKRKETSQRTLGTRQMIGPLTMKFVSNASSDASDGTSWWGNHSMQERTISGLPNGVQTAMGSNGANLSKWKSQRRIFIFVVSSPSRLFMTCWFSLSPVSTGNLSRFWHLPLSDRAFLELTSIWVLERRWRQRRCSMSIRHLIFFQIIFSAGEREIAWERLCEIVRDLIWWPCSSKAGLSVSLDWQSVNDKPHTQFTVAFHALKKLRTKNSNPHTGDSLSHTFNIELQWAEFIKIWAPEVWRAFQRLLCLSEIIFWSNILETNQIYLKSGKNFLKFLDKNLEAFRKRPSRRKRFIELIKFKFLIYTYWGLKFFGSKILSLKQL